MTREAFKAALELIKKFKAQPDVLQKIYAAFPEMKGIPCAHAYAGSLEDGPRLALIWTSPDTFTLGNTMEFKQEGALPIMLKVEHRFTEQAVAL